MSSLLNSYSPAWSTLSVLLLLVGEPVPLIFVRIYLIYCCLDYSFFAGLLSELLCCYANYHNVIGTVSFFYRKSTSRRNWKQSLKWQNFCKKLLKSLLFSLNTRKDRQWNHLLFSWTRYMFIILLIENKLFAYFRLR